MFLRALLLDVCVHWSGFDSMCAELKEKKKQPKNKE
jgi:hypothetical protein